MRIRRRQQPAEPVLTRDAVQEDRAHLLAWLAALHPSVLLEDPTGEQPPVLSITFDGRNTLWVIASHEACLFDHVTRVDSKALGTHEFWQDYRHADKLAAVRRHIRSLGY